MIRTVAVFGAGVMGAGIAQALAVGGCIVRLTDISPKAIAAGMERIEHGRFGLARVVAEGIATEDQVDTIMKDCFRWPMGPFEMQRPGSMT